MIASILRICVACALIYTGITIFMYVRQRDFMYLPDKTQIAPSGKGFAQVKSFDVKTGDGERLVAWWSPPADENKPVFLYLHGNSSNLSGRAARFQQMVEDGSGLLAIDWRGYGGSTGTPSEEGLLQDTMAAYQWLTGQVSPDRVVVFGESLGSGPAVWLASKQPVAALVLDSPFLSAVAMAQERYWYLPVTWLMKDTFRSDQWIRNVTVPVLILHGDADPVVPFAQGEALFARAPEPKQFHRFPGGGHVVAYNRDGKGIVRDFVAGFVK
jgi:uncharacterized protein